MELSKIQTLSLMLDQERKNLDALQANKKQPADIACAEQNIRKLTEQLKQICGEVNISYKKSKSLLIFFTHHLRLSVANI